MLQYLKMTLGVRKLQVFELCSFQIVLTLPSAVFVVYWWIVPESVRWLISKGRYDQAK